MELNHKAYCGDAVCQLVVGEIRGANNKVTGVLSNRAMSLAWCNIHNLEWKKEITENGYEIHKYFRKKYFHQLGTKFEAMIYDMFLEKGYEKTKQFIIDNLISLQGDERLI